MLGYDIGVWGAAKRAVRERFDLNDVEVEVLIGMLNIVAAVGGILSGKLSDKYGRSVASLMSVVPVAFARCSDSAGRYCLPARMVGWFKGSLNVQRKRPTQRVHVLTCIGFGRHTSATAATRSAPAGARQS